MNLYLFNSIRCSCSATFFLISLAWNNCKITTAFFLLAYWNTVTCTLKSYWALCSPTNPCQGCHLHRLPIMHHAVAIGPWVIALIGRVHCDVYWAVDRVTDSCRARLLCCFVTLCRAIRKKKHPDELGWPTTCAVISCFYRVTHFKA